MTAVYKDMSNNTFPIGTVIISLDNYAWEFDLFVKNAQLQKPS